MVQFLKNYIDTQGVETLIVICSSTAQKWLYKLEYEYKNVYKDMFIDRHKWLEVVEDHKIFLEKIEELKLYMVEFDKNSVMKFKVYLSDCAIGGNNRQPINIITHNNYIFFTNNRIQKA